jgi:hypothetical protein
LSVKNYFKNILTRKRNQHLGDIYYITKCLEGKKLIKRGGKYEQYY